MDKIKVQKVATITALRAALALLQVVEDGLPIAGAMAITCIEVALDEAQKPDWTVTFA